MIVCNGAHECCTLEMPSVSNMRCHMLKQDCETDFRRTAPRSASPMLALPHHLFASFFFCQGNLQGCEIVRMQQQFSTVRPQKRGSKQIAYEMCSDTFLSAGDTSRDSRAHAIGGHVMNTQHRVVSTIEWKVDILEAHAPEPVIFPLCMSCRKVQSSQSSVLSQASWSTTDAQALGLT